MGVDVAMMLEHALDREAVLALPSKLGDLKDRPALRHLAMHDWRGAAAKPPRWGWFENRPPGPLWPEYEGEPTLEFGDLLLTFSGSVIHAGFVCRWRIFAGASGLQKIALDACRELLPVVGGRRALISADAWLPSSEECPDYASLETRMREDFGPPLSAPQPLPPDEDQEPNGSFWLAFEL